MIRPPRQERRACPAQQAPEADMRPGRLVVMERPVGSCASSASTGVFDLHGRLSGKETKSKNDF
jgi:hypothetical protein